MIPGLGWQTQEGSLEPPPVPETKDVRVEAKRRA